MPSFVTSLISEIQLRYRQLLQPGLQLAGGPAATAPARRLPPAPSRLSDGELIEMKRICASNGEFWRLRMFEAYEQTLKSLAFMYVNRQAREQMEARLLQDLLTELGEYHHEA